jgi:hypothetical protein
LINQVDDRVMMSIELTLNGKEHLYTDCLCAGRSASPWFASLSASLQNAGSGKGSAGHFRDELLRVKVQTKATETTYKSVAQLHADLHGC